jgi:glycosyltransferase involved in cell wall biosynthesis
VRVLTCLHSFEPGGVERVALRLCRAWGDQSRLVMGRADGAMRGDAADLDIEFLSDGRLRTASWETLWMIAKLPAVIARVRPDVIFCAGNSYSIVAVAMKLRFGNACPPIVAKISNDLARRDMPQPVRWCYHRWLWIQGRFIDHFVGMAPPMRDEIAQAIGIAHSRISIIDDPALSRGDIARLGVRPAPLRSGTHFMGAGRLAPQKNFPLLVRAFARIARADDTLTILGEGPERDRIAREAVAQGVADRVILPGHVTDLAPWFARSDAFILSSDFEGVPAVIAEALAAGVNIVATDCSVSMNDMIGGGAFGSLVPVRDPAALARAMDNARTPPTDRNTVRLQANRFTVETAAVRYLEVFAAASSSPSALTQSRNDC